MGADAGGGRRSDAGADRDCICGKADRQRDRKRKKMRQLSMYQPAVPWIYGRLHRLFQRDDPGGTAVGLCILCRYAFVSVIL